MKSNRRPPRRHLLAAATLLIAVAVYIVVLAPITDVFTVPIHQNAVTGLGKTIMARVGPIQALAIAIAVMILGASAIVPSQARRPFHTAALVAMAVAAIVLATECLMIVGWAVTLWHFSDAAAAELGRPMGVSVWAIGWHIQIVVGFALLLVAWILAVATLVRREGPILQKPPRFPQHKHRGRLDRKAPTRAR